MLLGIGMLGGTARERRRRNGGLDPQTVDAPVTAKVWGRALAYTVFYFPMTIYILRIIPDIFNLPHYGNPVDYLLFILPMLLSTAFAWPGPQLLYERARELLYIHSVLIGSVPVPVGPDLATLRHERLVAVGRQYDPGGMGVLKALSASTPTRPRSTR